MKRFTETGKWGDPWFQDLPLKFKTLWMYLCDQCDHAGVWTTNFRLAEFQVGENFAPEEALKAFGERIEVLAPNKWLLVKFVPFQYPNLSPDCKPHAPVFDCLKKHNLLKRYSKGSQILQEKEKEKETDKVKDRPGWKDHKPKPEMKHLAATFEVLDYLNERAGKSFQRVPGSLKFIAARLTEGATVEACKKVVDLKTRDWLNDPKMKQYLRPETLFGATKFQGYMAEATAVKPENPLAKNGF